MCIDSGEIQQGFVQQGFCLLGRFYRLTCKECPQRPLGMRSCVSILGFPKLEKKLLKNSVSDDRI